MIGTTFGGQYRIDEEIGRGAMGIVYRGEDLKLHRPVAVKFLQLSGLGNAETIKKVLKEARTLAAVEHPAICPIYNVIENEDSACLVMGYVDGQSLTLYVVGSAKDEKSLRNQSLVSAKRAQAAADFLRASLPKDIQWKIYSWGAGPGGQWKSSGPIEDSQILIAVLGN